MGSLCLVFGIVIGVGFVGYVDGVLCFGWIG